MQTMADSRGFSAVEEPYVFAYIWQLVCAPVRVRNTFTYAQRVKLRCIA
jgi:hypothetical protein